MHRTAFAFGLGFAALMAGTAMAQDAGTPTKEMLSKAQTGKDNAGTWPGKPAIDFGPGDTGVWAHCSDCTHTKAYDAAEVYGTNPNRGVVLHLHDCRGLNIDKGWQREWLDYLKLNGFVVIGSFYRDDIFAYKLLEFFWSVYSNELSVVNDSNSVGILGFIHIVGS